MTMLHVVVGHSAAASLRTGLKASGRSGEVACFPDDLSYGPINLPDSTSRLFWIEQNIGVNLTDFGELVFIEAAFWKPVLSWPGQRVLWLSRRSAREYAGFLEIVRRLGDRSYGVIDITEQGITCWPTAMPDRSYQATVIAHVDADAFLRDNVLARLAPLTILERNSAHTVWQRLQTEDAPLRVVYEGQLVSAPLSHFDPTIIAQADGEWRKAAWVVGSAMGRALEMGHHVGDLLLVGRLEALIEIGALDVRGPRKTWFDGEVRRAIA